MLSSPPIGRRSPALMVKEPPDFYRRPNSFLKVSCYLSRRGAEHRDWYSEYRCPAHPHGTAVERLGGGLLLLVMLAALFLSFSRAAWGQFAFAALLLMSMIFLTCRSPSKRLRVALITIVGAVLVMALVAALLSIGQVVDLFQQRALLEQSYDVGHFGRFGRYIPGFQLALEHPFGIGPLQFAQTLGSEDPHNSLLNAFMSGGWLAGFAFLTFTL